jgi:hypothetical protein
LIADRNSTETCKVTKQMLLLLPANPNQTQKA